MHGVMLVLVLLITYPTTNHALPVQQEFTQVWTDPSAIEECQNAAGRWRAAIAASDGLLAGTPHCDRF